MFKIRRKLLSQNFLFNPQLAKLLVGQSSLGKKDLVLEIGPGKGIITRELVAKAGHVIAVELDSHWYQQLHQQLKSAKLTLYHADFLAHPLPALPYKVFANIPFAIEGKILRKLLEADNPPQDSYLVVMDGFADRLVSQRTNMLQTLHAPWFEFSVEHVFKPEDFTPRPNVTAVLLRCKLRDTFLLPMAQRKAYWKFVQQGYKNGQPVLKNLGKQYGRQAMLKIGQELSVSKKARPAGVGVEMWIQLFMKPHSN